MNKMFGTYRAPRKVLRFTISGYERTDGELYTLTDHTLYKSKKSAAKAIAEAINRDIDCINEARENNKKLPYITADKCMDGYLMSNFDDGDDRIEWRITQHVIDPLNI